MGRCICSTFWKSNLQGFHFFNLLALSSYITLLSFFNLKFSIYLFGCIGSQLPHTGSFPAVSLVVVCGLSCPLACGILVPRPGIELMSPALEGRFLTTAPPGKSLCYSFEAQTLVMFLYSKFFSDFQLPLKSAPDS